MSKNINKSSVYYPEDFCFFQKTVNRRRLSRKVEIPLISLRLVDFSWILCDPKTKVTDFCVKEFVYGFTDFPIVTGPLV